MTEPPTNQIPVPTRALHQLAELQTQVRIAERTIRNALDVPEHYVLSGQLGAFIEPPAAEEAGDDA